MKEREGLDRLLTFVITDLMAAKALAKGQAFDAMAQAFLDNRIGRWFRRNGLTFKFVRFLEFAPFELPQRTLG